MAIFRRGVLFPCLALALYSFRHSLLDVSLVVGMLLSFVLYCLLAAWYGDEPPPRIWAHSRVQEMLERCPTILRGPQPPWWARWGHLQLAIWLVVLKLEELFLSPIPFERHVVTFETPAKGKRCCRSRATPSTEALTDDICSIDVYPPKGALPSSAPCVVILPGLRGNSGDLPGTAQARAVVKRGWRCAVFHRRGHTPGKVLAAPRFDIFGDVEEVAGLLEHLHSAGLVADDAPLFLIGNSMGSALCVNAVRHLGPKSPFLCAVGVCPGFEVSAGERSCLGRASWIYEKPLLHFMKEFFCVRNRNILEPFDGLAYKACLDARTPQELMVAHVPFTGYESMDEYESNTNPVRGLADLRSEDFPTPVVLINAADDPVCIEENVLENAPELKRYDIPIGVVLSRTGTHCPFLDGSRLRCWSDQAIMELFELILREWK